MTYELTIKEYNKEAWKTYVNHTPPGIFTKSPVLPSIKKSLALFPMIASPAASLRQIDNGY